MLFRQIPNRLLTFEQLGLPDEVKNLLWKPRGLVLVTGPTGSGKSTTLAAMIDYINDTYSRHIITISYYMHHFFISQKRTFCPIPIDTNHPE